jgi:hypothetical protein
MAIMNIPETVYHGFYNRVDKKYPDLDEKTKWTKARSEIVTVLEKHLSGD